ncbi:hypothetical protein Tco_0558331 [Tanacetum coccineum]
MRTSCQSSWIRFAVINKEKCILGWTLGTYTKETVEEQEKALQYSSAGTWSASTKTHQKSLRVKVSALDDGDGNVFAPARAVQRRSDDRYQHQRGRSNDEEDLAVPWTCEEVDPFTPRIRNFKSSRKTRMPNNVKTYDGTGYPEDHVKKFQAAALDRSWQCYVVSIVQFYLNRGLQERDNAGASGSLLDSYELMVMVFVEHKSQSKNQNHHLVLDYLRLMELVPLVNLIQTMTLQIHKLHTLRSSAALHYCPPQDEHHHEVHPNLVGERQESYILFVVP